MRRPHTQTAKYPTATSGETLKKGCKSLCSCGGVPDRMSAYLCPYTDLFYFFALLAPLIPIKVQTGTGWDHSFSQYFHFISKEPNLKAWFKLNILKINLF